jgi:hypothetical protein
METMLRDTSPGSTGSTKSHKHQIFVDLMVNEALKRNSVLEYWTELKK